MSRAKRAVAATAVLLVAATGYACGTGTPTRLVIPHSVPLELVPPVLPGDLTLNEFTPARKAFAQAGIASLVADGRVWAIRRGQTLVGTLQISAVKADVSITDAKDRKAILAGVMTGTRYETIEVGDIKVAAATAADKTLYLWFGPNIFEVLQLKGTKVNPDEVAADVIAFQQATGKLGPVHA